MSLSTSSSAASSPPLASISLAAAVAGLTPVQKKLAEAYVKLYDNAAAKEASPPTRTATALSGQRPDDPEQFFAEKVHYRDPAVHITNLSDYKGQFVTLHAMFTNLDMHVLSIAAGRGVPLIGTHAGQETEMLIVESNCTYHMPIPCTNQSMPMTVRLVSRLGIENGKIASHEDLWSWADLLRNLPYVGRLFSQAQLLVGTGWSLLMRRAYAWKSGVPQTQAGFHTATLHAAYHPVESQQYGIDRSGDLGVNESSPNSSTHRERQQSAGGSTLSQRGKSQQHAQKSYATEQKSASSSSKQGEHKSSEREL